MAHKIFGQRFLSRSQPAWHGLGIIFPEGEDISPSEAVKRVAGDIQVVRVPMFYRLPNQVEEVRSDSCAIVRLPNKDDSKPAELGITSERWIPTSYPELAGGHRRIRRSLPSRRRQRQAGEPGAPDHRQVPLE